MLLLFKKSFFGFIFLSFLLANFLQTNNVAAQGSTTISVDPMTAQTKASCINTIQIMATDVSDLYAFDLSIAFDPAILQVVDENGSASGIQMIQGSLLDSGFTMINKADNTVGSIRFATTQINPQISKNGSGVLLVIRFAASSSGESAITITNAKLARPDGSIEPAALENGSVQVSVLSANEHCPGYVEPPATPTATRSNTVAPSRTPSRTPTRTSTPTNTRTLTRTSTLTRTYTPSTTATQTLTSTSQPNSLPTGDLSASASATPNLTQTDEMIHAASMTSTQAAVNLTPTSTSTPIPIAMIAAWQDPKASLFEVLQDYQVRKIFLPVILILSLIILIQLLVLQIRSENI